jgi:hypothetical protein
MGRNNSLSGVNLDTRLTCSPHTDQVTKKLLGPLLNRKRGLSFRNRVLLYKQLIRPMMYYAYPPGGPLPAPKFGSCRCYNPSVSAFLPMPPDT